MREYGGESDSGTPCVSVMNEEEESLGIGFGPAKYIGPHQSSGTFFFPEIK